MKDSDIVECIHRIKEGIYNNEFNIGDKAIIIDLKFYGNGALIKIKKLGSKSYAILPVHYIANFKKCNNDRKSRIENLNL